MALDNPMALLGQMKNVLCPSCSLFPFLDGTGAHAGEGQKKKLRVSEIVWEFFLPFPNQLASFPMPSHNKLDL